MSNTIFVIDVNVFVAVATIIVVVAAVVVVVVVIAAVVVVRLVKFLTWRLFIDGCLTSRKLKKKDKRMLL